MFFHLIRQYHGQLVGEAAPSVGNVSNAKVNGKPCKIVSSNEYKYSWGKIVSYYDNKSTACGIVIYYI